MKTIMENKWTRDARKLWRTVKGLKGIGTIKYRVVDTGELVRTRYQNSAGYFFDELLSEGKQPQGLRFIGGGDEYIDVAYDLDTIGRSEVEKFIRDFGIGIELVEWSDEE